MIFVALFLTAFVYLIFPIIYVANNGKVSPKKGKRLALWNTFICALIWFIATLIIVSSEQSEIGYERGGYSLAPAVFYYFIAKALLTDKNLSDNNEKPSNTAEETKSDMDGENNSASHLNENENSEK